ncbi:MAG TPA: DsbC family protein [Nevskiaceae bacterium]|nr:DsbC family protein [Nevskiaceae bacterium]
MKHIAPVLLLAAPLLLSACAGEYDPTAPPKMAASGISKTVRQRLADAVGQPPDSISTSTVDGMLEAKWGTNFAYVTQDGRYAVFGDAVNLETQEEVTENQRRGARVAALKELGDENTIEFAPAKTRYVVTVFTDVDCGYCRMLHRQVKEFNDEGIAFHYAFYPRSGPDTDSFKKAQQVWCAADRKTALTNAKNGETPMGPANCVNPVMREWELGQKLGLRGTPMLVLPNGEAISGYVPPQELLARLQSMNDKHAGKS